MSFNVSKKKLPVPPPRCGCPKPVPPPPQLPPPPPPMMVEEVGRLKAKYLKLIAEADAIKAKYNTLIAEIKAAKDRYARLVSELVERIMGMDEASKKEVEQMFDGIMYDEYHMWLPSMDIDNEGYVQLNITVDSEGYASFYNE